MRDDLDRRDRQRGAEEQGRDQTLVGVRQHAVGQELARAAIPHRNGTLMPAIETLNAVLPVRRTSDRSVSMPVSSSSIRMPSCETASIIAFCSGIVGNSVCCSARQHGAQDAGAEQDPGDQLAHDGRLTDPLHDLAEQPAAHQQQDDLRRGRRLRRARAGCRPRPARLGSPISSERQQQAVAHHPRPVMAAAPWEQSRHSSIGGSVPARRAGNVHARSLSGDGARCKECRLAFDGSACLINAEMPARAIVPNLLQAGSDIVRRRALFRNPPGDCDALVIAGPA